MATLNYIDENGNINKAGVIPKNYPSTNIGYDNSQSGLRATKVQGAIDELHSKIANIDWYFMRSDVTTSGSYESYSLQSGRTFSEFDMLLFTFYLDNWIVGTAYMRRGDFAGATGINIVGYYDVSAPIEFSVKYESDTSFQVKHSTTQTGTKKMSVVGIKF